MSNWRDPLGHIANYISTAWPQSRIVSPPHEYEALNIVGSRAYTAGDYRNMHAN
jgi:hypothetical protein